MSGGAVSDASTATCVVDADCGVGLVCDTGANGGSACVVGCHVVAAGGDTCPIGEHCNVSGLTIGVCLGNEVAPGTSTGACGADTDCVPGLVCAAQDGGGSECVVGCHQSGANGTCPAGAGCSVVDGGLGLCLATNEVDSSTGVTCANDSACGAGLVCDSNLFDGSAACVVGCHAQSGVSDTCEISNHCSVVGGALGVCLRNSASGTSTGSCSLDTDCVNGLVCDHSLDGGASCIFGCHATGGAGDTCPAGAHCSDVGGGVGVCLENGKDGGAGCCGGSGEDGGTSSGGGGSGGGDAASSSGMSDSGNGGSGGSSGGSGGDSGSSELDSSASDGAGGPSDATVAGDGGESADASGSGDATSEDAGPGSDAASNPGIVEGAGCSCSSAPGAASTAPDLAFGGLVFTMLPFVALVGRGRRRKRRTQGYGDGNGAGRPR